MFIFPKMEIILICSPWCPASWFIFSKKKLYIFQPMLNQLQKKNYCREAREEVKKAQCAENWQRINPSIYPVSRTWRCRCSVEPAIFLHILELLALMCKYDLMCSYCSIYNSRLCTNKTLSWQYLWVNHLGARCVRGSFDSSIRPSDNGCLPVEQFEVCTDGVVTHHKPCTKIYRYNSGDFKR